MRILALIVASTAIGVPIGSSAGDISGWFSLR
jgi:hypothetical protein